ncbi:helix-hairpin-helix domain-containing protein [Sphaerisporangium sp. TRM90804]|uniref:helix-hairpin-helix domain-containing protein n=1 Tax=Sphaerisporangium sp. TRM90804 TaxID=3031113 RepID=UPI0024479B3E|nr:helix-hairpin-helix domain-containing protein [Sphaerisporangium sp. TRM90804]MDH2428962.1 helix-hairpin-helix domain-containing protein [Sphaerisporangium sp. TRM90804]
MHPTNGHGGPGSGPPEPSRSGDPDGPTAPHPRQTGRPAPRRDDRPAWPGPRHAGPAPGASQPGPRDAPPPGPRPGPQDAPGPRDTFARPPQPGRPEAPYRRPPQPGPRHGEAPSRAPQPGPRHGDPAFRPPQPGPRPADTPYRPGQPGLRRGDLPFRPPQAGPQHGGTPFPLPPSGQYGLAPRHHPGPGPYGAPGHPGGHVPPPPFPPPGTPSSTGAASVFWAIAPLLTCGAATPFTIGAAAAKLKSRMLALSAAIYAIGWVTFFVGVASDLPDPDWLEVGAFLGAMGNWLGGTVHSLIIRRRVFEQPDLNDHAVAFAQRRRELRQEARELAARDPLLARELRIGRPDLPRRYDDGGLVDVNHAPARVIADLPGMTPELARRVVDARDGVGGFVSAEEMSLALDLPPHLTPDLVELTVYLS